MAALTREQLLGLNDRKVEAVELAEGLGTVYVRRWDGATRRKVERVLTDPKHEYQIEFVVAHSVCDENGNPLFTEADVALLATKAKTTLDDIANAAYRVNTVSKDAVETVEKN